MKKLQKNTFKFWVPIDKVEKSGKDDSNQEMIVQGIASTPDVDMDGEFFDQKGFVLDYFMKNGIINWHHQPKYNPEAVIGEPICAENTAKGLYIKGKLYPSSDLAKKVYKQMGIMKKDSDTRKIGWSIEGKVLKRDDNDPNHILQAILTGVAITHQPKNFNTYADIVKGIDNGEEDVEDDDDENTEEALSTAPDSGGALAKEDLEGKLYNVLGQKLSKADVYKSILAVNDGIAIEQCKDVYKQILKSMTKASELTADDINKAMGVLGIGFSKAGPGDEDDEDDNENDVEDRKKKAASKKTNIKKGVEGVKTTAENDEDEEANGGKQAGLKDDAAGASGGNKSEKLNDERGKEIAAHVEKVVTKEMAKIEKAFNEKFDALATLLKANIQSTNSLAGDVADVSDVVKSFGETTIQKSKRTAYVEKAFNQEQEQNQLADLKKQGYVVIPKEKRGAILNVLDDAAMTIEKGYTGVFGKAMVDFEAGGGIPQSVLQKLHKECKVIIS